MIGCKPQTLLDWIKLDEVERGERGGVSTAERERIKALEHEVKELRRTNGRARFSPRRSSTAVSSPEGLH